jgi:hypothetical protein
MNKEMLIKKIKEKAKQDQKKRRDPRFRETMGFLTAKGFLKANFNFPLLPNKRLHIEDAIWAGKNVEPRILEVLPAAVLRLGKHFDLDPIRDKELAQIVEQLRKREKTGKAFCEIPYDKIKIWADFPLRDKRVKSITEKKVVKNFRLLPSTAQKLRKLAEQQGCTETDIFERLIEEQTG